MKSSDKETKPDIQISGFEGYFNFLSNDYPTWVTYEGMTFPSISTAFQAARTSDIQIRQKIANVSDTEQFKKLAMNIKNPPDWAQRKQSVMEILIRDKFKRNKEILDKLMGTKDKKLVNTMKSGGFNQQFWGVYEGRGKNTLGKIIMSIRDQFNKGLDTKNWIQNNLGLQKNEKMFAVVELMVYRDGKKLQKIVLNKNKSYYLFGSLKTVDFHLQNLTISRNHACIYFSNDLEVMIVDLNSTHGTFLKRKGESEKHQLQGLVGYRLYKDDILQFGTSTREYIVDINRVEVEKYIMQQQAHLNTISQDLKNTIVGAQQYEKLSKKEVRSMLGLESKCILVEGIKQTDNYYKIKQIFSTFQNVKNVKFKINYKTGKNQGVAIMYFDSYSAVNNVIKKAKQIPYKIKAINQKQALNYLESGCQKHLKERNRSRSKEKQKSRERSRQKKQKKHKNY